MSRKILLLLTAALLVAGTAWAQTSPSETNPNFNGNTPVAAPTAGLGRHGFTKSYTVDGPSTTEASSSAGRFGSDADDILDVRYYDPSKELLFLGFGSDSSNRTDAQVGFSKKFGDIYAAIFYQGNLGNVTSGKQSFFWNEFVQYEPVLYRNTVLRNNVALLIGLADMGFRLDATHSSTITRYRYDDRDLLPEAYKATSNDKATDRGTLALSWGAKFDKIHPWAELGYVFGGRYTNHEEGDGYSYTQEITWAQQAGISAGAAYELAEDRSVGAALAYRYLFPEVEKYTGIIPLKDGISSEPPTWAWGDSENLNRRFGGYAYSVDAYYSQTLDYEVLTVKFKPELGYASTYLSKDIVGGSIEWADNADRWITVDGKVKVGVEIRPTNRTSFYAGSEIKVFAYTRWDQVRSGEDEKNPAVKSSWRVDGINVETPTLGMTFSPSEKATAGISLSDLFTNSRSVALTLKLSLGGN